MNGLQEAVHAALTHPIKSYIPDNMSFRFVTERLHDLVEGDWRGKAQAILIERLHSGWGEVSAVDRHNWWWLVRRAGTELTVADVRPVVVVSRVSSMTSRRGL
jgi:hypothetical protein